MTITYMFHAKDRTGAKSTSDVAPDTAAEAGLSEAGLSEAPAVFVPHPRFRISDVTTPTSPAQPEAAPAAAAMAPLLLVNPATARTPMAPAPAVEATMNTAATEAPATHDPAPPVMAGLPVRYVRPDARLILVAKARGGVGATTLAVNLALELQMQAARRNTAAGGRVALVDLDVQLGNVGSLLDLADRGGMLALANLVPEPDTQAVRHAMLRHSSGLSVLTAPANAMPFEALDPIRIASIIDALTASHDVVVVDLPPALIDWLAPLLDRAERLLMVTDLAVPSITRARRIITQMTEDRPDLPIEIVVAHEKKPFRLGQIHRDAATALGHALRHWLPEETKLARQAMDRGEPLVQLAPRAAWSKAVRTMATGLVTPPNASRKDH